MDTLDLRERAGSYPTRAQRDNANDAAQIAASRVVAALANIRRDLTRICDGGADYSIKTVAEGLLDDLDVIEESAADVLAAAVDASGCEIHELPRAAARAMED